jgi:hypothetical protein
MNILDSLNNYARMNHLIDMEDKLPIFACSIGAHMFNAANKCSSCDFDPKTVVAGSFCIPKCPLRHSNPPFYTPRGGIGDTRIHIMMRGMKGSGKSVLIDLFLSPGTGILYNPQAEVKGEGFLTMVGPNSITEAGMFGSVNEEGEIMGRPLAREMCGGFLGFEEFSSLVLAGQKDHSTDMVNQLLTSTDNGRVNKGMRSGWVRYETRYTLWGGTQPARFELESGLDRRFFIIDIEMSPQKELEFKRAQQRQSNMSHEERVKIRSLRFAMREWIEKRMYEVILNPPVQVRFADEVQLFLEREDIHSYEADLFRRLMIGYWMMHPKYEPKPTFEIRIDERLGGILDSAVAMRRAVMDTDLQLIKEAFWNQDLSKSTLVKEVARMITMGDYQASKRWIDDNLLHQDWYHEFRNSQPGRGRKGIVCRIGYQPPPEKVKVQWGEEWVRGE